MIKDYYMICRKYFKLGVNNKKHLKLLFISALSRDITVLSLPVFVSLIIQALTTKNFNMAFVYVGCLAVCYVLYDLMYHWNYVCYKTTAEYTYTKLQKRVVEKVVTYDQNFTKKLSKSYLVNSTTKDIWDICSFADAAFDGITHFIGLIIAICILLVANCYVGFIAIAFTILYMVLLNKYSKKRIYHLTEQRKSQDNIAEMFSQVMDGNKEIRSFAMEKKLNEHLDIYKKSWSKSYFKKRIYINHVLNIPMIIQFAKVIIYLIIIIGIIEGNYTVATLVLLLGYFERVEAESGKFYEKFNTVYASINGIDRLTNILNYKNKNMVSFGNNVTDSIFGMIDFDDVSFRYENNPILKNVSFHIDNKELTVIVGHSGSGKSTIFRLLLRLYKQSSGSIYIDGVDINDYSKEVYSSNVSVVTQKPFIFNMSIRDNLSLVDSNRRNQEKACKRVGIHDFIMSLPKGYNTVLKEDATDISGGQKQLIALARVLLSKSEILLFDEITSALDPNTTKEIVRVLKDLKKDHTVIMITHKPSLMKKADKLIVIDKGRVVGIGRHKILLENNKYYQSLQK